MRRKLNAAPVCIFPLLLFSIASLAAPARNYPMAGKVLEANAGPANAHAYKIETVTSIYKLLCYRHVLMVTLYAECSVKGKPLTEGDEVHLRTDGKTIFLESGNNKEQPLSILLEETKNLAPLPTPPAATGEGAVVLARGLKMSDQSFYQPSSPTPTPIPQSSSPTIPTGPVVVVPSTGGVPVLVTPTAPAAGGVVTGVNTANGQPVTGVATSPISNPSTSPPLFPSSGSAAAAPAWISVLYLETEGHIYQLECSIGDCALSGRKLALGDPLVVRIEGKWAYVSSISANSKSKESKFRILSVSGTDEPPSSQPFCTPESAAA